MLNCTRALLSLVATVLTTLAPVVTTLAMSPRLRVQLYYWLLSCIDLSGVAPDTRYFLARSLMSVRDAVEMWLYEFR